MSNAITISNIGGGAVDELFQAELEKVVENMLDPNCDPKAKREIVLRIVIKPVKGHSCGDMEVYATSKTAPPKAFTTRAYFGKHEGKVAAFIEQQNQAVPIEAAARKAEEK